MVVHNRHNCVWLAGYYTMYIINSVGHLKSNSVNLLVLWTIVYNSWGTNIVLQVLSDSANSTENY